MATNIGAVLKAEIARVARKEIRAATEGLQRSSGTHRSDIAALKRRLAALEQFVKHMAKVMNAAEIPVAISPKEAPEKKPRFSPKRFAAERARLGFSARQMGRLVDVSQAVIYTWEEGKVKPSDEQVRRIVERRGIAKEEALKAIGEHATAGRAKKSTPAA